jgi:hypothetical protein
MNYPTLIALWSPAPGCGKTTVANFILQDLREFERMPFAAPMRRMLTTFLFEAGCTYSDAQYYLSDPVGKELDIPQLPYPTTGRHLLRTLGTEWGRTCIHPDVWVQIWEQSINGSVITDDLRFPNEAAAIRRLGGEIWCIHRPGVSDISGHASEAGLRDVAFDLVLNNDGTIRELHQKVARHLGLAFNDDDTRLGTAAAAI